MTPVYWMVAFVVLIGIELATQALTTVWFAGGALISFFLALLLPDQIRLQLAVFVIVSFVLLFFTRPLAKRLLSHKTIKTNADSLIGRKAKVTSLIDNSQGTGSAVIGGQEWTARAFEDGKRYQTGEMVWIRRIQGVKLIVSGEPGEQTVD